MTALSYTTGTAVKARLGIGSGDTTDDTLLGGYVNATNEWIEQYCGRQVGPVTAGTATFDATYDASPSGRTLYIPQGIRTFSAVTVAPSTGATGVAATTGDLVVLPRSHNRRPDWPGFELEFIDAPTGAVATFGTGYGNITVVGAFGWAAIPYKVAEIAEAIVVRIWHARMSGQTDIVGSDETGAPLVTRFISGEDRATLRDYRVHRLVAA